MRHKVRVQSVKRHCTLLTNSIIIIIIIINSTTITTTIVILIIILIIIANLISLLFNLCLFAFHIVFS